MSWPEIFEAIIPRKHKGSINTQIGKVVKCTPSSRTVKTNEIRAHCRGCFGHEVSSLVEHQLVTPYTPQQNEVNERRNQIILELARCVLHEKDLQKEFMGEAANTTIFSCRLDSQQKPWRTWHHLKHGMDTNIHSIFSKCSVGSVIVIIYPTSDRKQNDFELI